MSKSNRNAIKEKQSLQNELSVSIVNTNKRISSWLAPLAGASGDAQDTAKQEGKQKAFDDFFQLPIIGGGSGLNLSASGGDAAGLSISTIDDHIKNRKTIKVRSDSSKYDALQGGPDGNNKRLQVQAGDSASMKSLKNKLRKDKVRKLRDNNQNNKVFNNSNINNSDVNSKSQNSTRSQKTVPVLSSNNNNNDSESESDSEKELQSQRSKKKKTSTVAFGAKVKKRK